VDRVKTSDIGSASQAPFDAMQQSHSFLSGRCLLTTALLVDDHPLFREGVALLLAGAFPQWQILQAGSLAEALVHLEADPDIALVLLDIGLPDSAGFAGLIQLRNRAAHPRYVVVSAIDSESAVREAIGHGAAGFIPKTSRVSEMLAALRIVMQGGIYVPPAPDALAAADIAASSEADPALLGLSPRQVDVLRLLIEGHSNKAIGRALDVSESTVKTHLLSIFRKLGANSRTQAVAAAARMGLGLLAAPITG
jgi:DNA-binding NarL/FixJ family response regulator